MLKSEMFKQDFEMLVKKYDKKDLLQLSNAILNRIRENKGYEYYSEHDIMIYKRVIADYKAFKSSIDSLINDNKTIDEIKDFIIRFINCEITGDTFNEENEEDLKYLDMNVKNFNVSIYSNKGKLYVGESIEIWDDENQAYIGQFNNTRELENIVKKYEELV